MNINLMQVSWLPIAQQNRVLASTSKVTAVSIFKGKFCQYKPLKCILCTVICL